MANALAVFDAKVEKFSPRLQRDLALKGFQADGVFGNLGEESRGLTDLQEDKPVIAGSRGGRGWAMWTGKRRVKFETWCADNKLDPDDDEANYGFLVFELKGAYLACLVALRATRTRDDAVRVFEQMYEFAGITAMQIRIDWAERAEAARLKGEAAMNDISGITTKTPTEQVAETHAIVLRLEQKVEDLALQLAQGGSPAVVSGVSIVESIVERFLPAVNAKLETQINASDVALILIKGLDFVAAKFLPSKAPAS